MSLDHDLGAVAADPYNPTEEEMWQSGQGEVTGFDFVKWLCMCELFPTDIIIIHSWNPAGAKRMSDHLLDNDCVCPVIIREFKLT
jgi:hypothetical protein